MVTHSGVSLAEIVVVVVAVVWLHKNYEEGNHTMFRLRRYTTTAY